MSRRRVVVTGLGCVSPVGNTVEASWAALLAGKSGIAKITGFDASTFTTHFAGEVKDFKIEDYIPEKEARHMGRPGAFLAPPALAVGPRLARALGLAAISAADHRRDLVGAGTLVSRWRDCRGSGALARPHHAGPARPARPAAGLGSEPLLGPRDPA